MNTILYAAILLMFWPIGRGWKDYHMTNAPNVPAARGQLDVKVDKNNGNTDLKLKVENLADPARLTPPANVYVVWVQAPDGQPHKQGVIRVNKNFTGEMDATTTVRDGEVYVTPEASESVNEPSQMQVLHAHFSV